MDEVTQQNAALVEQAAAAAASLQDQVQTLAQAVSVFKVGGQAIADSRARADSQAESRSEEHTSELQSLMRNSYAVFCLKQKKTTINQAHIQSTSTTKHNNTTQNNKATIA